MPTINRRIAASIEGDFVVFIIGARLNRWWKLPKYLWFLSTMPKMLAEVAANPKSGFLGWAAAEPHDEHAVLAVARAPDRVLTRSRPDPLPVLGKVQQGNRLQR